MKITETTRKCIVTGELLPKESLLRFCVTPDKIVVPDFKKKLAAKGVYVSVSRKILTKAVENNLFAKVLKEKARPADGLVDMVENLLKHEALSAVSLARKAGCFVCGMEKVLEAIKKNQVAFILEAADAGNDGHQRVKLAAKEINVIQIFSTEELDRALNKENTVYIAFLKSNMAKMVNQDLKNLADFLNK